MDTIQDGRIDVMIYPNGGREVMGRIESNPELPEQVYMPQVEVFVSQNQGLPKSKMFTGIYSMKDDVLTINWSDWLGKIPHYGEEMDSLAFMQKMRERMQYGTINYDNYNTIDTEISPKTENIQEQEMP